MEEERDQSVEKMKNASNSRLVSGVKVSGDMCYQSSLLYSLSLSLLLQQRLHSHSLLSLRRLSPSYTLGFASVAIRIIPSCIVVAITRPSS